MSRQTLREAPLIFRSSLSEGHTERSADTLNLLPYAQALTDFIQSCETPMTIGIQGDWGIGKTSLMNMLRGHEDEFESGLLDETLCQVVSFETWSYSQFNDGNDLLIACMHAITNCVVESLDGQQQVDSEQAERTAKGARAMLRSAAAHMRGDWRSNADDHDDSPGLMLSFRQAFEQLVGLWTAPDPRRRLVIFVDDLDRVPPAEALIMLEGFKNFLEVPGCVFVLAVDYDVVQKGMAQKLGADMQRTNGKALYEKLIQVPFVLPTAFFNLSSYISGLLQQARFSGLAELANDEKSARYFLDISLCTLGRNPRNIKRVVNYASLLERVRERQGGQPMGTRDAKILYALICMQVAWPELFRHFVADPTVDTVTSLQNWEFLDNLPEARQVFEREMDSEQVKANVGSFFDILFAMLDDNQDGQVDTNELVPVVDVMKLASMTAVEPRERQRDWFVSKVRENNTADDPLVETFLSKVYMKTIWYLGSECRYRKCGNRYVTVVHHGKQIGSLVSLPSQPFVFRLAMAPEKIKSGLKAYWKSTHSVKNESITFNRSVFGKESSMTGFGDTVLDFSKMTHMPAEEAINLLNALFRIVTGDELPEWELDNNDGKKKK